MEWWYNTTYNEAIKMTTHEIVYGQQTPLVISYLPSASKVQVVDNFLQSRDFTLATLKDNLVMA